MRRRSRLSRQRDRNNKKTIFFSIIGIAIVLFVLFKFGIETLINFSLFLSGNNNSSSTSSQNKVNYVAPPLINSLPQATSSARIIITGTSDKNTTVILFINGRQKDLQEVSPEGGFDFQQNLSKGVNEIKAKAKYQDKESDYSNIYNVFYNDTPPKLEISSPSDDASFKKEDKTVQIQGETDTGVTVTINGFFAVIGENNSFSYVLSLHDGENEIKVLAVDQAGNTSEKSIKVNYSP